MQRTFKFVAAIVMVAAVTLTVSAETTGPAASGQTYDLRPPNIELFEWLGAHQDTKIVNENKDNEFVNPSWVVQEAARLGNVAGANWQTPQAWVVHSWWHRLNYDDAQPPTMAGPYTGDLIDTPEQPVALSMSEALYGTTNAMHYSFVRPGYGGQTLIEAVGTVNSMGMDTGLGGGFEPKKRVARRGKDQSRVIGWIENAEMGHWEIEFEAALKLKAGATAKIDPLNDILDDIAKVDASAYGRLRVFYDGECIAVDDGEARRTNMDSRTGVVNVDTQYGFSNSGGYYSAVTDAYGHDWGGLETGEDGFWSTYDVVQVKGKVESEGLELKPLVYSSYAHIRNEVQPNAGSGMSYARVTHGHIRRNSDESYNDYKSDLDDADKEMFRSNHPWKVKLVAYEDKYLSDGTRTSDPIEDFNFE